MRMDGPGKAMNVSELLKEQKLLLFFIFYFLFFIFYFFIFYCASRTTTMPGLSGPAGQQPCPDPVYFIVPVGQQPCLDFSGRQDSNHIRIPFILLCQKDNNHAWTFRAGRTATISGSRYFIVPVGQQPCLDFSGRQDSNHIRIPLFYCASRTTTMPGLFGPAGQQPYPDPVYFIVPVGQQPCLDFSGRQDSNHIRIPFILYTCVDIYIYVSFIIIILVAMGHQS